MKKGIAVLIFISTMAFLMCGCGKKETSVLPGPESRAVLEPEKTAEEKESVQAQSPAWYGTWEVKDCQTASVYALSGEEIKNYLTYTLTYSEDSCLANGVQMETEDSGSDRSFHSFAGCSVRL